ncbi:acetyl-CoA carboxylase carboxyltransferase subunit alpha [Candidatus Contubernalis alkaliaceticus]|uniref:acetyl-CoA carboxylase carboxyltransferase subunit alpha n=1 Tax=Candidatus Contubernalis alkaliaceticus TaxID=338645 RepID=UPI001F4BE87B|nr:acetyl-CoA carboxylase carboxyltransferase subunit alpha [Candidatus Contubernalis alkalaceticus]UNC91537.1 acetyl-CoA carboxylase carboxyltransferase subunit alpha [Candidatus Contubernalis alkalaceticus]
MSNKLEFDLPINELQLKIKEIKTFSEEKEISMDEEIKALEERLSRLKKEIYNNLSAWQKTQIARYVERPSTMDYIKHIFKDFIELHGDRQFGDDKAMVGGLAFLDQRPVTIIGHRKGKDMKENVLRNFGMPHPEGYQKVLRLMRQAEKFNRPVISFIDTPGAFPGIGAEERGQGRAIAENLMALSCLKTPVVAVICGEGGSGGALALSVGDRICMLEHAVYSVISPEGCASILWKDANRAEDAASVLRITAQDLLSFGVIDMIISEPLGGAHRDFQGMAFKIKEVISNQLKELDKISIEELVKRRYDKFRKIGEFLENTN